MNDPFVLAGREYRSRLIVGTGKYRSFAETRRAIDASGAEIVTVAIRRTNIGQNPDEASLLDHLPPSQFTLLLLQQGESFLDGANFPHQYRARALARIPREATRLGLSHRAIRKRQHCARMLPEIANGRVYVTQIVNRDYRRRIPAGWQSRAVASP